LIRFRVEVPLLNKKCKSFLVTATSQGIGHVVGLFVCVCVSVNFCGLFFFGWLLSAFSIFVDREERIRSKLKRWSEVVREFDRKLEIAKKRDVWICPRCFSVNVVKRDRQDLRNGKIGRLKCKDCGYTYRREKLPLSLELPARIVNQILRMRARGSDPSDVCEEVKETAYDYGFRFKISRTETYNVEEKATKLISWLDRFVAVGLLEGVPCDIIEVDEIFQHKIHRRILEDFF